MAEALVRNESPAEYFRELVETALERQQPRRARPDVLLPRSTCSPGSFTSIDPRQCASRRTARHPPCARAAGAAAAVSATAFAKSATCRCSSPGFFADSLTSQPCRRGLLHPARRVRVRIARAAWRPGARGRLRRAGRQVLGLRRRPQRGERTKCPRVELRRACGSMRNGCEPAADAAAICLVERGIVPNASVSSRFIQ